MRHGLCRNNQSKNLNYTQRPAVHETELSSHLLFEKVCLCGTLRLCRGQTLNSNPSPPPRICPGGGGCAEPRKTASICNPWKVVNIVVGCDTQTHTPPFLSTHSVPVAMSLGLPTSLSVMLPNELDLHR